MADAILSLSIEGVNRKLADSTAVLKPCDSCRHLSCCPVTSDSKMTWYESWSLGALSIVWPLPESTARYTAI